MTGMSLHQTVLSRHQARAVQTIDRHWHQKAAGGRIPKRSDIDPGAIQDALEYAFVAEQISGGHARLRVAGGSISAVMGMEVAGMPLAVLIRPDHRDGFARQVERVFIDTAKVSLQLSAPAQFDQPGLDAELRLYPLLDASGRAKQVLGSFATSGTIGRSPRRFAVAAMEARSATTPIAPRSLRTKAHLNLVVSNG